MRGREREKTDNIEPSYVKICVCVCVCVWCLFVVERERRKKENVYIVASV